jgi:hypothetical protein
MLGPLLAAAAISGAVELSDRSEVRVRNSGEAVGTVLDLETAPAALLRLHTRRWDLAALYSPRLVLRQVDAYPLPEVLHRGALLLGLRFRRALLGIHADGAYGTYSFTGLVPAPTIPGATPDASPPPIQQLPPASTIAYASLRAGASLRYAATRRLTLSGVAEHRMSGGVDEVARAVVPFQYGPHGELRAEYALSRKDRLVSSLDASWATFTSGPRNTLVEATEAWQRALGRRTRLTIGGGAALVIAQVQAADPRSARPYPLAEAEVVHRIPARRVEARFALRLAPIVDRLSGRVDERLGATASAVWSPTSLVAVRALGGAAQTLPGSADRAFTLMTGEAAIAVRVSTWVRVEAGTRGAWQGGRGAGALASQWVVFSGATVTLPPLRF